MLTTIQLLDLAKLANSLPSDYQLAQALGVSRATVSSYRLGKTCPDLEACEKLAQLAGLDADVVVCSMQAQRTSDDATRALWTRIAARLQAGAGAAAAVILSALFFSPSEPANAMDKGTAAVWVSTDHRLPVYTSWQVSNHTRGPIFMGICAMLAALFPPLLRCALHRV